MQSKTNRKEQSNQIKLKQKKSTIKNLIKEADNRLYKAKGNGRNQIF